jgi:hypothetical protein
MSTPRIRFTTDKRYVGAFVYLFGLVSDGKDIFLLTRAETEQLRDDIDAALNPQEAVVQVSIRGGAARDTPRIYSYRDPSGTLVEGDLVRVPFGFYDAPTIAVVKQLGRGAYKGPLKDVQSKFTAEEL